MCEGVVRPDLQRLPQCDDAVVCPVERNQNVAFQSPAVIVARLRGKRLFDEGERTGEIPIPGREARLRDQCGCKVRFCRQRVDNCLPRRRQVFHQGVREAQRGLQIGLCLGCFYIGFRHFVDHALKFRLREHGSSHRRQRIIGRVFQFKCLAQFNFRGCGAAFFEQKFAQEVACFRRVRILLQRVLQLHDCGLVVIFRQVFLGRREHGFRPVAAA